MEEEPFPGEKNPLFIPGLVPQVRRSADKTGCQVFHKSSDRSPQMDIDIVIPW
jgi:hypothetical protein